MKYLAVITGVVLALTAPTAAVASMQSACLKSSKGAGQRALCGCVQQVANMTLSARDQRLAATFFADPHRAQEIRQSPSRRHEAFWERYKVFGQVAERRCSR